MSSNRLPKSSSGTQAVANPWALAAEYLVDASQRSVLFWDVMRQRGNQYREQLKKVAPNVLDYDVELVMDGRTLARPVNYVLVRIMPPSGVVRSMASAAINSDCDFVKLQISRESRNSASGDDQISLKGGLPLARMPTRIFTT